MRDLENLLQQAHDLGARFKVNEGRIQVKAPSPLPDYLMAGLREHKSEVQSYLAEQVTQECSLELPFPLGYEGLPIAQVEAAEGVNGRLGVSDPVHRKYNVLTWVQGYYEDRDENHGPYYEAVKQEKQRLGKILDQEGIGT